MDILFVIFFLLISVILVYLSIFDIKYKEIPFIPCLIGLGISAFFVILNTLLGSPSANIPTFQDALIGFILLAGLIWIIVFITKERGMGEGDIFLFGIMGISLGLSNLFTGFLVCVYSATIYGLILSVIKRKFHGLQIPLVPFISVGIILTLIFHPNLFQIFNRLIGLT